MQALSFGLKPALQLRWAERAGDRRFRWSRSVARDRPVAYGSVRGDRMVGGAPAPAAEPLHGEVVRLRPVTTDDAVRLTEIVTDPGVARWWGNFDLDRVRREMIHPEEGTVALAVEADDQVIGLVQYWEETDPDYRHAAIDIFLDPAWHGRGLGTDAVRTLARYLFEHRRHHRLTIDPAAHNQRAIRSYQRVGFRPVGIMRRYERSPNGTWHDALLMDLLPEDLTPPRPARKGSTHPDLPSTE